VNVKSLHDMWLNEGWASYCEYLTAEKLYPNEAAKYMDNFHNQAYIPNGRVFVDDTTSFSTIYDNGRVYAKGAAICHTLRDIVGNDSLFFGAIKGLQTQYKQKNLDIPTFKTFVEKFTGKDLTLFFDQWYYGYGYPRQTITYYNTPSNVLKIRMIQQGSSNLTPIFKTKVEFLLKRTNQKDTLVSVYSDQKDMIFSINNVSGVTSIVVDPRNVILNKVVSIKEDATLTTTEVKKNEEFVIFPNPAQDYLAIKASVVGNYTVEIFDADASLKLRKEKMTGESLVIDILDLASGQYILKIYQDKKKVLAIKQFVITK
jgi:aminopeptidase N